MVIGDGAGCRATAPREAWLSFVAWPVTRWVVWSAVAVVVGVVCCGIGYW